VVILSGDVRGADSRSVSADGYLKKPMISTFCSRRFRRWAEAEGGARGNEAGNCRLAYRALGASRWPKREWGRGTISGWREYSSSMMSRHFDGLGEHSCAPGSRVRLRAHRGAGLSVAAQSPSFEVAIVDKISPTGRPGVGGELRHQHPDLEVILTHRIRLARLRHQPVKIGAFDYIQKPIETSTTSTSKYKTRRRRRLKTSSGRLLDRFRRTAKSATAACFKQPPRHPCLATPSSAAFTMPQHRALRLYGYSREELVALVSTRAWGYRRPRRSHRALLKRTGRRRLRLGTTSPSLRSWACRHGSSATAGATISPGSRC